MKKVLIIIGIIFAIIFVILVSSYFFIKSFLTTERITKFVEDKIERTTGFETKIEKVIPSISLKGISIEVYDFRLYSGKREFVKSEKLELGLKIIPIFFKRIEIGKIILLKPFIEYRIEKKEPLKKTTEKIEKKPAEGFPFTFLLENLEVKEGKFILYNKRKMEVNDFNLSFKGSFEKNLLNARGKSSFNLKIEEFKIPVKSNFSFKINLQRDLIEIDKLLITLAENEININGKLENILYGEPSYNISLISENFYLEKFSKFLRNRIFLKGKLSLDITIKGKGNPFIYGKLNSKKVDLEVENQIFTMENFETDFKGEEIFFSFLTSFKNAKSRFEGNVKIYPVLWFKVNLKTNGNLKEFTGVPKDFLVTLSISGNIKSGEIKGSFNSDRNYLNLNIRFDINKKIDLTGNVSSSYLNLNEIIKEERDKRGEKGGEIPFLLPPNLKLNIDIFIKEFIYKENNFKDIRLKLTGEDNKIEVKNLRMNAYGGSIEGNATLKKGSLFLDAELKGENIRIEKILSSYRWIPFKITGNLKINSKTSLNLEDIMETLTSSNSSIILNGYLEGNTVLKRISEILKLEEIKMLHFNKIEIEFQIKKGFLYFPDFRITANDLEVLPKGKVSLKGEMDLEVDFIFKGAYIRKLKNSGILPQIIPEIKALPISFWIKGRYDKPDVKVNLSDLEREIQKNIDKELKKEKEKKKKELEKKFQEEIEKLKRKLGG